jgi:hypothetical protein
MYKAYVHVFKYPEVVYDCRQFRDPVNASNSAQRLVDRDDLQFEYDSRPDEAARVECADARSARSIRWRNDHLF